MTCSNQHPCPCTKQCVNHAKCCDCISKHASLDHPTACLKQATWVKHD